MSSLAEPLQGKGGRTERRAVAERQAVELRRAPRQERLENAGVADQLGPQRRPGLGFGRARAAQALAIGAIQHQRRPGERQRHGAGARHGGEVEAVPLELQGPDHFRRKAVDEMGERRDLEARREL